MSAKPINYNRGFNTNTTYALKAHTRIAVMQYCKQNMEIWSCRNINLQG